jgi:hypothetical protein
VLFASFRRALVVCGRATLIMMALLAVAHASTPAFQNNLTATSQWLETQQLPDGAILFTSTAINPYFANLGAQGWTKDPSKYTLIEAWMQWYVDHLNFPDQWGLNGTIYNYNVNGSVETSTGDADSTDAYAATFISLAWAYWNTGNGSARSYIQSIESDLDTIASVIVATQQSDGLTWAKPDYQYKLLMDNSESYQGLTDAASLFSALGNRTKSQYYSLHAEKLQQGIQSLWISSSGGWAVYKDSSGSKAAPNFATWYPDATSQLYPVLHNVVSSSDSHAKTVYTNFNKAWPGWPSLSFSSQDPFPWVTVAAAAARMGDNSRVNSYILTIQNQYVATDFPWPWYCLEAGWFMRVNALQLGDGL